MRFRRRDNIFEAREELEFKITGDKLRELERYESKIVEQLDAALGNLRTKVLDELWKTYEERFCD